MTAEAQDVPELVEQILTHLLARPISRLDDGEAPLRELGLTSLRMIQLLGELESTFPIRVMDEEVAPLNFETIDSLIAFVTRKLSSNS